MKIVTRTYTSVTHRNGENGCATTRTAKTGDSGDGTGRGEACLSEGRGLDARPTSQFRQRAALSGRGKTLAPGRLEWVSETVAREFVPLAAGRSEAAAGLPGRVTSENEFIFLYCVRGRGWCEIEGCRHEIMSGQLFVVPAKSQPSYATYGERLWSLIWIQLATINTSTVGGKLHFPPQMMALGPNEKTLILALFQDVLQAFEMPCPQRLQQVSEKTKALLDRSILLARENPQMETDARIGRTIDYMREHLNEPLRAATLAGVAKMSLPHYFAQFKRVIGSSPIDYLIKLRMDQARRLLEETSWSVKEVAVSLGYDDPLYFSRVFKSINQTAPTDFRASRRNTGG